MRGEVRQGTVYGYAEFFRQCIRDDLGLDTWKDAEQPEIQSKLRMDPSSAGKEMYVPRAKSFQLVEDVFNIDSLEIQIEVILRNFAISRAGYAPRQNDGSRL